MSHENQLPRVELAFIGAAAGGVDPRTVRRFLRGERVHGASRARIVEGLRALGRLDLVPAQRRDTADKR